MMRTTLTFFSNSANFISVIKTYQEKKTKNLIRNKPKPKLLFPITTFFNQKALKSIKNYLWLQSRKNMKKGH